MFKENDFLEIEFTILIKETSQLIETTSATIAKEKNMYYPNQEYKPKIICLGQHQIFPAIEKELKNLEINKELTLDLPPEKAFGKKNPKLLQLIPMSKFKAQNINPYPTLPVNIDNMLGIVRAVSGGRVIVDFNHPFSGRNILAKIKVLRLITDTKTQVSSILSLYTRKFKVTISESKATITANLTEPLKKEVTKKILELVPIIKKINITKE